MLIVVVRDVLQQKGIVLIGKRDKTVVTHF